MAEICEKVSSDRGQTKINARGYLMVKDKSRDDLFYWCCERRKSNNCKGRASTILVGNEHHLTKFVENNHTPAASRFHVATAVAQLKGI